MIPRSHLRLLAAGLAVCVTVVVLALAPSATPQPQPPPRFAARSPHSAQDMEKIYKECCAQVERHYRNARKLATVPLAAWKNKYDGKLHTDRELATAVYDMLQANTDDKSAFFELGQFQWWLARTRHQDVGALVSIEKHRVTGMGDAVKTSGHLKVGDFVLFVNGQNVDLLSDKEVQNQLNTGPPGSVVRLTVLRQERKGEHPWQHSFDLVRTFETESAPVRVLCNVDKHTKDDSQKESMGEEYWDSGPSFNLARIEVVRMQSPAIVERTIGELEKIKKDKVDGLCLDLTGLTGGGPNVVAALAALFLEKGELFTVIEEDKEPVRHVYLIENGKLIHRRLCGNAQPIDIIVSEKVNVFDKPMTIALDLTTDGGAKILAAVLKERATIVGPVTDPVQPCQIAYPVGRQHYVVLSAARYMAPNGAPIDVVHPDDVMEPRTSQGEGEGEGDMGNGMGNGISATDVAERAVTVLHETVRNATHTGSH